MHASKPDTRSETETDRQTYTGTYRETYRERGAVATVVNWKWSLETELKHRTRQYRTDALNCDA